MEALDFSLPLLLLLLLLMLCFSSPCASTTHQQDVTALTALRAAWSSNPSSWDSSTDPCAKPWLGIGCDSTNTRITRLVLINQNLNGSLPAAIGDLTNLTDLDLSSNPSLGGSLPNEIGKLIYLRKFFVQFCDFSGLIPSSIGNMTNLQFLGLTGNSFTGPLPATIGLLKNMLWLDLSSNNLTGNLPDSTKSGTGSGLDNLTSAGHLHLQNNSFSGSIPSSIFNPQMQLLHLLLHDNKFTGIIPPNIGDLLHVQILRLDNNHLSDVVPFGISTIKNLTTLQLNNNALTGQLPDLSNNKALQMLELGNNPFNTSLIPAWITNLTKLRLLSMQSANLIGNIPPEIFELDYISNVTLGSNNLNGTLNLSASSLELLLVNLTNNDISGLDIGNYAQELLLDGNPYCNNNSAICTSAISPALPPISPALSDCTNACPSHYAINPRVSGGCRCARPVLANVTFLASKLPFLTDYNISLMEHKLATGLSHYVGNLQFLDNQVVVQVLSTTQVTVSVFPPSITDVWSPNDAASISYVIKNQDIQFLDIGPIACQFLGSPYNSVVTVTKLSTAAKVGIGVGVSIFAIAIVVVAAYAVKQKKRAEIAESQKKPFAAWIAASEGEIADIPQLKGARWFSLKEIRNYTNNFNPANEIGEGGYGKVYKGYLLSGEQVAIKRAGTNSLQGAAEFKNEIELLSRVHHRNLVGLIGFCFEEGEQMLVYEYMPNGTLREGLSGRTGFRMDWERRLTVALGSARGIAYLHTEANPPIIHRDIKSSNILLDDKLVAKVADFGLSVNLTSEFKSSVWSKVKGTLGYLDPDYYMTNQLTYKSDVYSYGVVLLELVTGRTPIQEGKYVVRELKIMVGEGGMEAVKQSMVDPKLIDYASKSLEILVELALRCVEDDPTDRPTMAEVVKELEALSSQQQQVPVEALNVEIRGDQSPIYSRQYHPLTTHSFEYSGSLPSAAFPK